LKQQHKIDLVVALSLACLAAVREGSTAAYNLNTDWIMGPGDALVAGNPTYSERKEYTRMQLWSHISADARRNGGYYG
jgi:hypothetical protein